MEPKQEMVRMRVGDILTTYEIEEIEVQEEERELREASDLRVFINRRGVLATLIASTVGVGLSKGCESFVSMVDKDIAKSDKIIEEMLVVFEKAGIVPDQENVINGVKFSPVSPEHPLKERLIMDFDLKENHGYWFRSDVLDEKTGTYLQFGIEYKKPHRTQLQLMSKDMVYYTTFVMGSQPRNLTNKSWTADGPLKVGWISTDETLKERIAQAIAKYKDEAKQAREIFTDKLEALGTWNKEKTILTVGGAPFFLDHGGTDINHTDILLYRMGREIYSKFSCVTIPNFSFFVMIDEPYTLFIDSKDIPIEDFLSYEFEEAAKVLVAETRKRSL